MTATALVAAALGIVVGVVIGGLGGGGGVLTVPALVYVLGQDAHDATTGGVLIVGVTALVGTLVRVRERGIEWRTGIAFGAVGVPAAYLGTLLNRNVDQPVLLIAFACLTVLAAAAMLWRGDSADDPPEHGGAGTAVATRHAVVTGAAVKIVVCGAVVGFLTGFLGVGGGFLVVPVLVIALRMPMTLAIGTSLLIIALNSVSSVAARVAVAHFDWWIVVPFALAGVLGTLAGKRVADRLSGRTLGHAFAWLLVAVGLFVGVQSLLAL